MKLSLIIVNYNVRYFLEQCLLSVQRATSHIDSEIIVVDNQSTDESCEMVRAYFPEVTLIENKENVGFSRANNQGVAVATGTYVCILNPDTAVPEDTFSRALQYFEETPKIGSLGVRYVDGTGNFLPECKRNVPTPSASVLKLTGFTKKYYATQVKEREKSPVPVLAGAFMLMKRSVYLEVGGFDEDYFMYGEDIDLSYKITQAGYQNHYLGEARILHYKGESTQKDGAYYDRFFGAMKIFYHKHFHTNRLFNTLVDVGVSVAKKSRKARGNRGRSSNVQPTEAIVFTENLNVLRNISEHLHIPVTTMSKSKLSEEYISNKMLIFDAAYMSYSQILKVMESFKNQGNTFRICPPGCNFMVGSDRSDDKGAVLVF